MARRKGCTHCYIIFSILYMQAEGEVNQKTQKIIQTINRSADLLSSNKPYEFAQKIKSLALRKAQTSKLDYAETLLKLGIKKMFAQQIVDYKSVHDLIINLIELYQKNRAIATKEKTNELYTILTSKPNEQNIVYLSRILKNISSFEESPEIADFVVSYYQVKGLFYKGEHIIVHMDLSRVMVFLEKWHDKVDEDEFSIIACRMALLKGLYYDFDEPMVLLSELETQNPFVKFVKFLVLAVQMKSREGYEKLGVGYHKFLESDPFFGAVYEAYGAKFFKKEKAGSGLLNFLEN